MPKRLLKINKSSKSLAITALLAACLMALSQVITCSTCSAGTTTKKVTKIDLRVAANGNCNVLIADDGIEWRMPRNNLAYYCLAPKWEIVVFNTVTKNGRTFPYDHWLRKIGKDAGVTPIRLKSKIVTPSSFQGHPARLLYAEVEPMESLNNQGEFFYQSSSRRANDFSRMEILELQDKTVPKQALEFVRWKFGMPFLNGPLLKSTNVYPDHKREITINATTVVQTTVPMSEWRLPKFKRVTSTSLVTDERTKYKNAAELFDNLLP